MAADATGFTALTVTGIERDTDDSVVVTFGSPEEAAAHTTRHDRFTHGQHLTLRRFFDGVEVRRSYSICSPAPHGVLRVAIKQVPGGVFSTWAVQDLQVGDEIDILSPAGNFTHTIEPSAARRYSLLAAGSGITPIFSIAATILQSEPDSRLDLLYLNRTTLSTMLLDELQSLRDRYLGRFRLTFAFTREESAGELLSGRPDRNRLDRLIGAGLLPSDVDHAFLCGPIDLVETTQAALIAAGMPPSAIHREIFTAKQHGQVRLSPQEVSSTSVVVGTGRATLHGRSSQFDIFAGDSVLDAVQRARPDVPFSCRAGVCSTCQAIIRDGTVDMATNYGLSNDEVDRGYILTCQARPTAEHIDIDYDV